MLYSPITGKRVKEPFNHITWVHKTQMQPEFELKQCFFGEHLLQNKMKSGVARENVKPVAVVESEKTAVIASVYLPKFIWLAVGSLTNLNAGKWSNKARELSSQLIGTIFTVSDLLERKATDAERKEGLDIADYLIKLDYKDFVLTEPNLTQIEQPTVIRPLMEVKHFEPGEPDFYFNNLALIKTENWEQEISELEIYFENIPLPLQPKAEPMQYNIRRSQIYRKPLCNHQVQQR